MLRPQRLEPEEFEPQDVRNDRALGIGEAAAGEIGPALERMRHPRQQLLVLCQRVGDEFGIEPVLDHAALVLGAPLERRLVDFREPDLAWHFEEIGPEGGGEGENGAGVVDVFVDQLVVHAHLKARWRIRRHQRRTRKSLVEIIEDERRFHDWRAVVDEGGHDSVRIELEIGGLVLIAAQGEQVLLRWLTLLRERDAHLLRADRVDVVVELEHRILLPLPPQRASRRNAFLSGRDAFTALPAVKGDGPSLRGVYSRLCGTTATPRARSCLGGSWRFGRTQLVLPGEDGLR